MIVIVMNNLCLRWSYWKYWWQGNTITIDSSLDKVNFEKVIYLNREGNFEEYEGTYMKKMTINQKDFLVFYQDLFPNFRFFSLPGYNINSLTEYSYQTKHCVSYRPGPKTTFSSRL